MYTVGLDFGTESARLVVVDTRNGAEALIQDSAYRHGVFDTTLPDGRALPPEWALQHPGDYLEAAETLLRAAVAAVGAEQIAGIGVDFTSSTVLPTDDHGTPLCLLPAFAAEPHAYVKLWKHHGAAAQAERIAALRADFLLHTGGQTSPEWLHAKALEIFEHAPHIFSAARRILEGGDWLIWQLTGVEARSACQAGFKAHFHGDYPASAELERLAPGFSALNEKLTRPRPVGTRAGGLTPAWAERCGLTPGTPVGVAIIDAHAAVPGLGVVGPGVLVAAMGTSTCHILLAREDRPARGIAGVVYEGVYPGLYAYETGQAAAGDMLAWWVRMLSGGADSAEHYARLETDAARLPPGGHGLIALDWWNGSRTPLMDPRLSGVLAGLRIETQPAEIYRALLEATSFGNRAVIDLLEAHVGPIREVRASGGLTRSPLLMQILADVLNRDVLVAATPHASARGAAIYGALAAGLGSIHDICERMAVRDFTRYTPDAASARAFDRLYGSYRELHQYFGEGGTELLRQLRR